MYRLIRNYWYGEHCRVAMAISTGGSGAIFWMWIVAVLGMSIKFLHAAYLAFIERETREATYLVVRCITSNSD